MSATFVEPASHLELIDGREVQKPVPKKFHALIQAYLTVILWNVLHDEYDVASELNVWCGPDRLVPDVTVARLRAEYRDGDLVESPALVAEIMSPGQTIGNLLDKASRLVAAGANRCWVIWPEQKRAWTLTPDGNIVEEVDHLQAHFDTVAVTVPLLKLWAELERG
jgi:Uma2 family endonuclease